MRLSFKADMKKGQCSCCPCIGWSEGRSDYICGLTGELTPLEVDSSDCPLEEVREIENRIIGGYQPSYSPVDIIPPSKGPAYRPHRASKGHNVKWHPYPKEKPTENERHLLTCQYPYCTGVTFGKWWDDEFVDIDEEGKILAWAEIPKPYKEERE